MTESCRTVEWKILEQAAGTSELRIVQSATSALVAYLTCSPDESVNMDCNVSCMKDGPYQIHLNVSNFMGKIGLGSLRLTLTRKAHLGRVRISGEAERSFRLQDDVTLQAISSSSTTSPTNYSVTFAWDYAGTDEIFSDAFKTSNIMKDNLRLFIPSFSLPFKVGVQYSFNFTVTQHLGTVQQQSWTVLVTFFTADPVAEIIGKDRTVSYLDDLILDGTRSYDPNIPLLERSLDDLAYCWSCTDLKTNLVILRSQESIWNISANFLDQDREYVVILRVFFNQQQGDVCASTVNSSLRYGEDKVFIRTYLAPVRIPVVQITSRVKLKYNMNEKIRLTGQVFATHGNVMDMLETSWGIDPPPERIQPAAPVAVDPYRYSTTVTRGTVSLVLDPGLLLARQVKYSITLLGTFAGLTSTARVEVAMNQPPGMGDFTVHPSAGTAMLTEFVFDAPFWTDEDLPVSIEFGFVDYEVNQNRLVQLNSRSEEITLRTMLPKGDSSSLLRVYCLVTDALGAATRALCESSSTPDCVLILNGPPDETLVRQGIDAIFSSGDTGKILALPYISVLSLPPNSLLLGDVLEQGLSNALSMARSPMISDHIRSQLATSVLVIMLAVEWRSERNKYAMLESYLEFYDNLLADKSIALDDSTGRTVLEGLSQLDELLTLDDSLIRSNGSAIPDRCIALIDDIVKATMRARIDGESFHFESRSLKIVAVRRAVDQLGLTGLNISLCNMSGRFDNIVLPSTIGSITNALLKSVPEANRLVDIVVQVHKLNPYALLGTAGNKTRSNVVVLNFYQGGTVGDKTGYHSLHLANLTEPITLQLHVLSIPPKNSNDTTGTRTVNERQMPLTIFAELYTSRW
eukprot:766389-Hanusia_phi.AAC.2